MAVLKCKMCGSNLNIIGGQSVCECECCGTHQTVPLVDDEKKINMYARANHLRFNSEFDKASGIYESIIAEAPEEAEAYWGLVLCKYGIEYVDDPISGKKIPNCRRSIHDSVLQDPNFDLACEYADPMAKEVYREEARQIEEFWKQKAENRKKRIKNAIMLITITICTCIALAILLQTAILPSLKIRKAKDLIESGDYISAYKLLDGLNYQDSEERRKEITPQYYKALWADTQAGDVITFGTYEQDNKSENGKEAIQWRVLDKMYGKILVVSQYALDCKPYNTKAECTSWENCSLRKWLNDDFINTAFTPEQQKLIPSMPVLAYKNQEFDTNPGNNTEDRVFLLSIAEANQYFEDWETICKPTPYAVANHAYESGNGTCWWWLRSPGNAQNYAAIVFYFGGVNMGGFSVDFDYLGVRPAFWIDLKP